MEQFFFFPFANGTFIAKRREDKPTKKKNTRIIRRGIELGKITRDEEIVIKLGQRNKLRLLSLSSTTGGLLVSFDAMEATRAYRATWAFVF